MISFSVIMYLSNIIIGVVHICTSVTETHPEFVLYSIIGTCTMFSSAHYQLPGYIVCKTETICHKRCSPLNTGGRNKTVLQVYTTENVKSPCFTPPKYMFYRRLKDEINLNLLATILRKLTCKM